MSQENDDLEGPIESPDTSAIFLNVPGSRRSSISDIDGYFQIKAKATSSFLSESKLLLYTITIKG